MSKMHFEKTKKKGSKTSKGFYIALGVCLVAIGAAAWTTYDGVKNYMSPTPAENGSAMPSVSSKANEQEAGTTVSGVPAEPSSQDASSDPAKAESTASSQPSSKAGQDSSAPKKDVPSSSQSTQPSGENQLNIFPSGQKVIKEFSGDNPIYSQTLNDWRVHEGVDFSAEKGSMVKAVSAGTAKDIYEDPMLGTTIVIEHTGFEAYYCGLGSTTLVKKGDTVKLGQEIGSVNEVPSESVDENHLHFAIEKGRQMGQSSGLARRQ